MWTVYAPPKLSTIKRGPFAETNSELWRAWDQHEKSVGYGGALDINLEPNGRYTGYRRGCYVDLEWAEQQSAELLACTAALPRRAPDHAAARKAMELISNCTKTIDQEAA
jgi:hypothetical protein